MVQMFDFEFMWMRVLAAAGTEEFGNRLNEALDQSGLTIKEFAERYEIPESTLYKITSGEQTNFRVQTLRSIIDGLKSEEGYDTPTIGLITTRSALDVAPPSINLDDVQYNIKPLPANSIEEEIIRGVDAERDGVAGLICGPIAATTLEKVVEIPVAGLRFDARLMEESIREFVQKLERQ